MKKIFNLCFALLSLCPLIGLGQTVKTVEATGVGFSEQSALRDAFRNAVSQVLPTSIVGKTEMENGEVIKDEILTVSAGFVENYKVLQAVAKNKEGLYTITISADVKYDKLVKEIKGYSSTGGDVDIANTIEKQEAAKEREEQLRKIRKEEQDEMFDFMLSLVDNYMKAWQYNLVKITPDAANSEIVLDIQGVLTEDNYVSQFVLPTQKIFKGLNIIPRNLRKDPCGRFQMHLNLSPNLITYPLDVFQPEKGVDQASIAREKLAQHKYILRIELKDANQEVITSRDVEIPIVNLNISRSSNSAPVIFYIEAARGAKAKQGTKTKEIVKQKSFEMKVYAPLTITDVKSIKVNVLKVDAKSLCDEKW